MMSTGLVEQPESASVKPPMTIARAIRAIVLAKSKLAGLEKIYQ
jgi:hypothetical protein